MNVRSLQLPCIFVGLLLASGTIALAQSSDIARLVHPEVAERVSLTDPQRTEIQKLLQSRAEALVAAKEPAAKEAVRKEY